MNQVGRPAMPSGIYVSHGHSPKSSYGIKWREFSSALIIFASFVALGSSYTPRAAPKSRIRGNGLGSRVANPVGEAAPVVRQPYRNLLMKGHDHSSNDVQSDGEIAGDPRTSLTSTDPRKEGDIGDAEVMPPSDEHDNPAVALLTKVGESLSRALKIVSSNHAALAATVLLILAVFLAPLPSLAVGSGGRMGGSFGSSGRTSSGRTYSAPSSSYSRGFSSGYYSRPSVVVTPSVPVVTPYYSPFTPFYSPFWAPRPSGVVVSTGPSFFGIFGFLAVALVALTVFGNTISSVGSSVMDSVDTAVGSALGPGVSVAQISVALDVSNRDDSNSILSVLNRLSNTARTDSRVGIQNLTSQVALELLRRKQSIVASSSKSTHFRDRNKASREFNKLAVKERGKFERETVSQYGGVDYSQGVRKAAELSQYSPKATMAVVTIILAIEGDSTKLPVIRSQRDVEDALSRIASDAKVDDCLQSAEILWTPEERSETLTMRDVVSDYPSLHTI